MVEPASGAARDGRWASAAVNPLYTHADELASVGDQHDSEAAAGTLLVGRERAGQPAAASRQTLAGARHVALACSCTGPQNPPAQADAFVTDPQIRACPACLGFILCFHDGRRGWLPMQGLGAMRRSPMVTRFQSQTEPAAAAWSAALKPSRSSRAGRRLRGRFLRHSRGMLSRHTQHMRCG